VGGKLGMTVGAPIPLHLALARGGPLVVTHGGFSILVGARGSRPPDPRTYSFGTEAALFRLDRTLLAERWRDGQRIRRVERVGGGALVQEGVPGHKREPPLDAFDAAGVLHFGVAWRCDLEEALQRNVMAWPLERRPSYTRVEVGVALGGVGAIGFGAWIATHRPPAAPPPVIASDCGACRAWADGGGPCADELATCRADPGCAALDACLIMCRNTRTPVPAEIPPEGLALDFSCDQACLDRHADGVPAYTARLDCEYCDACEPACGWMANLKIAELALITCR
jgi:hypothetical protein